MAKGCIRMPVLYLFCWVFISLLWINEGFSNPYKKKDACELAICAIFKNEAPYLKEWIEFHRILGWNVFIYIIIPVPTTI